MSRATMPDLDAMIDAAYDAQVGADPLDAAIDAAYDAQTGATGSNTPSTGTIQQPPAGLGDYSAPLKGDSSWFAPSTAKPPAPEVIDLGNGQYAAYDASGAPVSQQTIREPPVPGFLAQTGRGLVHGAAMGLPRGIPGVEAWQQAESLRNPGNMIGQGIGSLTGMVNPANAAETALSVVTGGAIRAAPIFSKIVGAVGSRLGPRAAAIVGNTIEEGGEEAAFAFMQQSEADADLWLSDPAAAFGRAVTAAASAGAVGGMLGGGMAAAGRGTDHVADASKMVDPEITRAAVDAMAPRTSSLRADSQMATPIEKSGQILSKPPEPANSLATARTADLWRAIDATRTESAKAPPESQPVPAGTEASPSVIPSPAEASTERPGTKSFPPVENSEPVPRTTSGSELPPTQTPATAFQSLPEAESTQPGSRKTAAPESLVPSPNPTPRERQATASHIPPLENGSGSWVVSRRDTGDVVGEFYDRRAVERFNPDKVVVETAGTYLRRINAGEKLPPPDLAPKPEAIAPPTESSNGEIQKEEGQPQGLLTNPPSTPPPGESRSAGAPDAPESITSARKAMTAADREAMGLAAMANPERHSWEAALDEARKEGLHTRDKALSLADEVNTRPRAFSDVETGGLVQAASELKKKHAQLMKDAEGTTDPAEIFVKAVEIDRVETDFDNLTQALRKSGTEKGRALAAQKLTLNSDNDLVSVITRAKVAKGSALTPEQRATFESLTKRATDAEAKLADLQKQVAEQAADQTIKRHAPRKRRMEPKAREAEYSSLLEKAKSLISKGCD